MSRSDVENRQKIENFVINLKRKLRLDLWPNDKVVTCACNQRVDAWGDHAFCCTAVTKTTMNNDIRGGLIKLLWRLLTTVRLIANDSKAEREVPSLLTLAMSLL